MLHSSKSRQITFLKKHKDCLLNKALKSSETWITKSINQLKQLKKKKKINKLIQLNFLLLIKPVYYIFIALLMLNWNAFKVTSLISTIYAHRSVEPDIIWTELKVTTKILQNFYPKFVSLFPWKSFVFR